MKLSLFIIAICLILFTTTCRRSTEPLENYNQNVSLTVESAEVTEVWLRLKAEPVDSRMTYVVQLDTHTVFSGRLERVDTLLHDENLRPAREYTYTAWRILNGERLKPEIKVQTTTMDTTSHNIIWQIDTIGAYPSIFRDVAVIKDTLIWAVGEIYDDEREVYGAAIYNGKKWQLKQLISQFNVNVRPDGFWAFSKNNLWFAHGSISQWDGKTVRQKWPSTYIVPPIGLRRIWATDEKSIFFVGDNGAAMHYNGSNFKEMQTFTNVDLTDIWGTSDNDVWASGYTEGNGTVILHYDGSSWSKFHERSWDDYHNLDTTVISGPAVSIWTDTKDYVWVLTYWGLYKVNSKNSKDFIRYIEVPEYKIWVEKIRGIASNDLLYCGDFTAYWHFNGSSIFYYPEFKGRVSFTSITSYHNNFYICGVDYETGKAILLTGSR